VEKDPTPTNNRQAARKTNILKPNMKLKVGQVVHRWEGTLGGISLTADCRTRFLKGWQRQEERSARPQTNKQLSLPQPLQFVSLIRQHKQLSGIRIPFNVMESARVVTYLIAKILMGLGAKTKSRSTHANS